MSEPAPVLVVTTHFCSYCQAAKRLLGRVGLAYDEVDVTSDHEARERYRQETGWMTVPMIWVRGEFVGGYTELADMARQGRLRA